MRAVLMITAAVVTSACGGPNCIYDNLSLRDNGVAMVAMMVCSRK